MRSARVLRWWALTLAALSLHCSGSPVQPRDPIASPPPNAPPVIKSITTSASRIEVNTPVELRATVEDVESGIESLTFEWTAAVGRFVGRGPNITWEVPELWQGAATLTPFDYAITLTVVEQYSAVDAAGNLATREHRVTSSPVTVRVHNSAEELRDVGLGFLTMFADSSVSPERCVSEFADSCSGTRAELDEIRDNREYFVITAHELIPRNVIISEPYRDADVHVGCTFVSRVVKCPSQEHPWYDATCFAGRIERAGGTCHLTAFYEQGRWWLCSSSFTPDNALSPSMQHFFGPVTGR
jgi:hypothetical protein